MEEYTFTAPLGYSITFGLSHFSVHIISGHLDCCNYLALKFLRKLITMIHLLRPYWKESKFGKDVEPTFYIIPNCHIGFLHKSEI